MASCQKDTGVDSKDKQRCRRALWNSRVKRNRDTTDETVVPPQCLFPRRLPGLPPHPSVPHPSRSSAGRVSSSTRNLLLLLTLTVQRTAKQNRTIGQKKIFFKYMHFWSNYEAIQKLNKREKQLRIRTKPNRKICVSLLSAKVNNGMQTPNCLSVWFS